MAKETPPSFQFYPRDFLADVSGVLSNEQIGRYTLSLCRSWLSDEPGIAAEEDWREWMGYSDHEWVAVRPKIARLFKLLPSGMWKQKRMVEEREAQKRRHENSRKGADATNEKRWGSVANESLPESRAVSPASASASATAFPSPPESHPEEPHTLFDAAAPNGSWVSRFGDWWDLYDKKVGKATCLTLWAKLTPKGEALFVAIMDGTRSYLEWERVKRGFKLDPERFLKRRHWQDEGEPGTEDEWAAWEKGGKR